MSELPSGWKQSTIGKSSEVLDSRRIPLNARERAGREGPYAYYGANGQAGTINGYIFEGDHILLAEDGGYFNDPHRPNAYTVTGKFWVNNHAHVLRPTANVDGRFLLHALNATDLMPFVSGTTRLKLTQGDMRRIPIALPPLAEQRRIVARIEALFARTRRARADLERIAPLAQYYVRAEAEQAFAPNPELGWGMTTAGALAEVKSGVTLGKRHADDAELVERPYLRVANVQRGRLKLDEVKTIRVTRSDAARLELRAGDVLMNEGGDRDKLGRGWVWDGQIEGCIHQNHVFRLRLRSKVVTPRFLSRYANHAGARYFLEEGKQTTNLASISLARVAALPVPVPPPGQAGVIDQYLDHAEEGAARIRGEAARALALLDRLEQSILARAFRGELVPQDPSEAAAPATAIDGGQPARPRRSRAT